MEATAVFYSPLPVSPTLASITEKCWIFQILQSGRTSHSDFNKHMLGNEIMNLANETSGFRNVSILSMTHRFTSALKASLILHSTNQFELDYDNGALSSSIYRATEKIWR